MRFIMFIVTIVTSYSLSFNFNNILKEEKELYLLYTNSFREMLIMNLNSGLKIDGNYLENYFTFKGIKVEIEENDWKLCVKFDRENFLDKNNDYCFYMVKNNG